MARLPWNFQESCGPAWKGPLLFLGQVGWTRWPPGGHFEKNFSSPIFISQFVSGNFQQKKKIFLRNFFWKNLENFWGRSAHSLDWLYSLYTEAGPGKKCYVMSQRPQPWGWLYISICICIYTDISPVYLPTPGQGLVQLPASRQGLHTVRLYILEMLCTVYLAITHVHVYKAPRQASVVSACQGVTVRTKDIGDYI